MPKKKTPGNPKGYRNKYKSLLSGKAKFKKLKRKRKRYSSKTDVRDYKDPIYKMWRQEVKKRDKYKCQFPGCKSKNRRNLHIHHIFQWAKYPHMRFEPCNGITLCPDCHKKVNGHEDDYIRLFMTILSRGRSGGNYS